MTDVTAARPLNATPPVETAPDTRPYSPGMAGVIGAESARVDNPLHARREPRALDLRALRHDIPEPVPAPVLAVLRLLPQDAHPMDALRTAVSVWGATQKLSWPPTPEQARRLTAFSPSALAAFGRLRRGLEPVEPDLSLDLAGAFLQQLTGAPPDLASAVCGAIGALKGPLHGGAPAEVVSQLHEIGSIDHAEAWVRQTIADHGRIMGFGHRVYRAYDPRAAALRQVAEAMDERPEWLDLAIAVEDVVLRVLAELKPGRSLKTNVEYYAAAVLEGVGLTPDLFPATFALARHAGWTAHSIEQAGLDKLIRPDLRYTGPLDRDLPV